MVPVTKAHAYGNDFLLIPDPKEGRPSVPVDRADTSSLPDLARALCDRHQGIGADGLVLFSLRECGASMRLLNADGSWSELSGNGLRCLAALVARTQNLEAGSTVEIDTDAGVKRLDLLAIDRERYEFRAAMGSPEDLRQVEIPVTGETVTASVLRVGNPQCVVLGPLPDAERFAALGPALSTHPMFPAGTNVEFVQVDASDRIRILIWERGVGPTMSSGTGSSASAVAAAAHGGAGRAIDVIAPGGIQHVEWTEGGVYLTGWAEIVLEGEWLGTSASTNPRGTEAQRRKN
jgi:diaminopimelate epimerase